MNNQQDMDRFLKLKSISTEMYNSELSYMKALSEAHAILTNPSVAKKPSELNLTKQEHAAFITRLNALMDNSEKLLPLLAQFKNLHADAIKQGKFDPNKITLLLSEINIALQNSATAFTNYANLYKELKQKLETINYNNSPTLTKVITKQNNSEGFGQSYLTQRTITGIQRLPRYELLFKGYAQEAIDAKVANVISTYVDKEYATVVEYKQAQAAFALKQYGNALKNLNASITEIAKNVNSSITESPKIDVSNTELLKVQSNKSYKKQFKSGLGKAATVAKKAGVGYALISIAPISAPVIAHNKGLLGRLKSATNGLSTAKKTSTANSKVMISTKPTEKVKKPSKLSQIKKVLRTKKGNNKAKPQ
jgi:hypothetical protein